MAPDQRFQGGDLLLIFEAQEGDQLEQWIITGILDGMETPTVGFIYITAIDLDS